MDSKNLSLFSIKLLMEIKAPHDHLSHPLDGYFSHWERQVLHGIFQVMWSLIETGAQVTIIGLLLYCNDSSWC